MLKKKKYTKKQIEKIDPKELSLGIKVELEHTEDKEIAKQIALDHLIGENYPNYYTKLLKLEKEMEKSMFFGKAKKCKKEKLEKTSEKEKWISEKISKLIKEGKPKDQATAIAFSMWRDKDKGEKIKKSSDFIFSKNGFLLMKAKGK